MDKLIDDPIQLGDNLTGAKMHNSYGEVIGVVLNNTFTEDQLTVIGSAMDKLQALLAECTANTE